MSEVSGEALKMAEQTDKLKRTRKRGPNVKGGCRTCKIRRKKCDENRPACLRCMSTGRTCDFLDPTVPSHSEPVHAPKGPLPVYPEKPTQYFQSPSYSKIYLSPSTMPLITPDEMVHFDYFRAVCTEEFSGFFNATLWKQLVLRATYTEPYMLYAVIAIGALRRSQLDKSCPVPISIFQYSMQQYNKAVGTLRQKISAGFTNWKNAILGSLVFLAIEVLQGHELGALMHLQSAHAILKSLPSLRDHSNTPDLKPVNLSNIFTDDIEDLLTAFTRLSVDQYLFHGSYGAISIDVPTLPPWFRSIQEAQTALNGIVAAMYFFLRGRKQDLKTLPSDPLPDKISAGQSKIQSVLQFWYNLFNDFIEKKTHVDIRVRHHANVLLVQYLVAWIQISVYFFHSQMMYDTYLTEFEQIVNMTSAVVKADNESWMKLRGPCFTLDIAMAQPLYFVAFRCRDPVLRRRAIEVMKKVGREGIYTGRTVAKVATWIVDTEEGGDLGAFVNEEMRLHCATFEFDRVERTAKIWATRKSIDGAWEKIHKVLNLV